jgi:PAS domain S-box-containing protein
LQLVQLLNSSGYVVLGPVATAVDALELCATVLPEVAVVAQTIHGEKSAARLATRLWQFGPVPTVFLLDGSADEQLAECIDAQPLAVVPANTTDRELVALLAVAARHASTLKRSRDPDERFFAVAIDMLCFLDFSGYFRRLSPAWERTLGFSLDELMSQPFIEFVHPDDRERTLAQNKVVRHGGQALGFENRYRCKDGSYRWLRWNAASDPDHGVIYSVARDITDARQASEEREELIRELQQALAEVRTLQEIIPICAYCRRVRDDEDYWQHVEQYIAHHTGAKFSHGVCPSCFDHVVATDLAEHP